MYTKRAIFNGELAKLFGPEVLVLDKFARTLGYRRIAADIWKNTPAEDRVLLESYCKGVNDFIESVSFEDGSAKLLPPEFYIFGVQNNIKPWHPVDSIANLVLIHLTLTWDWAEDFTREVMK